MTPLADHMNGIGLLPVLLPPVVVVAFGLMLAWLGRGSIILRGRRRRMGLLARLRAAWRGSSRPSAFPVAFLPGLRWA